MRYRAIISLNTRGGVIRGGAEVPASYPRLQEGLRRGWVEEIDDNGNPVVKRAAITMESPGTVGTVKEDAPAKEVAEAKEPEPEPEPESDDAKEDSDEWKGPVITLESGVEELGYLSPSVIEGLKDIGVISISDLGNKAEDDLVTIKGIGRATAKQLLESYLTIAGG